MSTQAPSVCTAQAAIGHLVVLIAALPAHGHVVLHLRDGSTLAGVVRVRASMQVFRDPRGLEGMNARVVLERPPEAGGITHVWLDQVERVQHLDSALASEN
ncbi:MAG: DUF3247 family protein [Rhodanobacter sp.]